MASPANYQRSGTDPIRSNQQIKRSDALNKGLKESGAESGDLRASDASTKQSTDLKKGYTASGPKSGGLGVYDATTKAAGWTTSFKGKDAHPRGGFSNGDVGITSHADAET